MGIITWPVVQFVVPYCRNLRKNHHAEVPVILCDEPECDGRSITDIAAERCLSGAEV